MRINELHVEAVKRIKVVDITCDKDEDVIVIGGNNAQGKTSVLDSIMYGLAGGKTIPDKPVRDGEERAEIRLDIGNFIITRTMKQGGGTHLKVETKDGMQPKQPQATLSKLCGPISFDPLEFARMKPKDQLATLRELLDIDTSNLDQAIATAFTERTEVKKELARVDAEIASKDFQPGLEHVDVAKLSEDIEKATQLNHSATSWRSAIERITEDCKGLQKDLDDLAEAKIKAAEEAEEAHRQVDLRLKNQLDNVDHQIVRTNDSIDAAGVSKKEYESKLEAFAEIDTKTMRDALANAETVNNHVRMEQEASDLKDEAAKLQATVTELTTQLDVKRKAKDEMLSKVEYPIDGLTMGEDGLLWNGQPFEQASSAESTRVSVALGMANNPQLRVMLIRDGSLLDENSLEEIRKMAKGKDYQIWIERVGDSDDNAIVIEDGGVREPQTA